MAKIALHASILAFIVLFVNGNNEKSESERSLLELMRKCEVLSDLQTSQECQECPKPVNLSKNQNTKTDFGTIYTRWGRTSCNGRQTKQFIQVAGSFYTHNGGSVNYICLPNNPNTGNILNNNDAYSYLYGAEYRIYGANKPSGMNIANENDVPCAICYAKNKSTTLIIPGRNKCFKGWTEEYNGYLMSGHHGHPAASEYACVDKDIQVIPGGSANKEGKLFYPVKTVCGSLKCPPYTNSAELLCVVCTR